MMNKELFIKCVNALRQQAKLFEKLEDALGGILLESLWEAQYQIYEAFEDFCGDKWTDDQWDAIYDNELSGEEVYNEVFCGKD